MVNPPAPAIADGGLPCPASAETAPLGTLGGRLGSWAFSSGLGTDATSIERVGDAGGASGGPGSVDVLTDGRDVSTGGCVSVGVAASDEPTITGALTGGGGLACGGEIAGAG
jgi:hypothetical protein